MFKCFSETRENKIKKKMWRDKHYKMYSLAVEFWKENSKSGEKKKKVDLWIMSM